MSVGPNDKIFQVNRALFEFPTDPASLVTPEGLIRVVAAKMFDASGAVDVLLCEAALVLFCGYSDEQTWLLHV